jgi:hypothetical protein
MHLSNATYFYTNFDRHRNRWIRSSLKAQKIARGRCYLRADQVVVNLTPPPLFMRRICLEKRFSKALAKWTLKAALTAGTSFFKRETKFYLTTVHEHG